MCLHVIVPRIYKQYLSVIHSEYVANSYLIVMRTKHIFIPKKVFETKYQDKFANPRNMVAGIINQKAVNSAIHDLDFVVYEIIEPMLKPSDQMMFLKSFNVFQIQECNT